jgi:hypothetical protein
MSVILVLPGPPPSSSNSHTPASTSVHLDHLPRPSYPPKNISPRPSYVQRALEEVGMSPSQVISESSPINPNTVDPDDAQTVVPTATPPHKSSYRGVFDAIEDENISSPLNTAVGSSRVNKQLHFHH